MAKLMLLSQNPTTVVVNATFCRSVVQMEWKVFQSVKGTSELTVET